MKHLRNYRRQWNLKTNFFDDTKLFHQNTIEKWTKGCIFPFPRKGDFGITKNYKSITFTTIAAKVNHALLLNRIRTEVEKVLGEKSECFSKKSVYNFSDSNYLRSMCKEISR